MSDNDNEQPQRIDPGRPRGGVFDRADGYSGQEYNRADAERQRDEDPSGAVDPDGGDARDPGEADRRDPTERGRRASFDPATGEVRGSGSGAGGGKAGEDYADPVVGSDGGEHAARLGQPSGRE